MFEIITKVFMGLLISIVNVSNHTKCVLLSNQKCMSAPNLINLHHNEYNQELHYYPFAVKLDKCTGSCNVLNYLSDRVFVANKTEALNMYVFNMIWWKKCNSHQWWNNDKCLYQCKSVIHVEKIIFGILLHVILKMENIWQLYWKCNDSRFEVCKTF